MHNCKPTPTPMTTGFKLSKKGHDDFEDSSLYHSTVGATQYAMITCPKISYCVNKVCQFIHRPLVSHWKAVKRILQYLQGTLSYGIHLIPSST